MSHRISRFGATLSGRAGASGSRSADPRHCCRRNRAHRGRPRTGSGRRTPCNREADSGIRAQPGQSAAAALIVVAIILIVMARVASRRGNRVSVRGTAGGAIVAVVFAIMLTVAALLISNLFKDGIVKPSSPDKSPAQSAQNMQQSVEEAGIYCESGWSELSSQGYPGVTDVEICLKPRIAYVTFDNEFAADMYRAPLRYKIAEMFDEQANSDRLQGRLAAVEWQEMVGIQLQDHH